MYGQFAEMYNIFAHRRDFLCAVIASLTATIIARTRSSDELGQADTIKVYIIIFYLYAMCNRIYQLVNSVQHLCVALHQTSFDECVNSI